MPNKLNSLWNFEFKDVKPSWSPYVFVCVIIIGSLYVLGEVIFGFGEIGFSINQFVESTNNALQPKSSYEKFQFRSEERRVGKEC